MLNSVGLQNPGIDAFIEQELPFMLDQDTVTIVNVAGSIPADYLTICEKLDSTAAAAIELNFSCPNVAAGCMSFGADPVNVESITRQIRDLTAKPIWVKLTPNITDIGEAAKAAEAGGLTESLLTHYGHGD